MKNLIQILTIGFLFNSVNALSQDIHIKQNEEIKQVMDLKKELAKTEKTFQIQIYSGNFSQANEELKNAQENLKIPISLTFETPNYKVRVGSFRYKIQAEKALQEIKKIYPSSFIVPHNTSI